MTGDEEADRDLSSEEFYLHQYGSQGTAIGQACAPTSLQGGCEGEGRRVQGLLPRPFQSRRR